ncbi:bifunctional 3,4-dihydroxy-2-butanone-4-phosphate synthase/GTP cyclohydrolase II [Mycobacterium sp. NAZ190054]|uniref:bifunctional 3,4-dihydroxy-2-butanone-4-phosphate synthase/GTP cyclohydrolase II n=1 Tax=Mycobacterium sp. NAZ190054 TaxID=1747766 RepID=UPI00079C5E83|nr:bifunctional 3,4-dihydroxy-2-butanone-4-phosphate synthase/GTP cyclohydrolase II [Mycobacterium sp. NAZ190054]KWX69278.1 hypothetical protein ASJ79_00320 [Mycobacterium sp. NAZ190054]
MPARPEDTPADVDVRRRVESAVAALASGRIVVVADDEDRENEGDLILAAEFATPENIAFMVRHTSGLLCVGVPPERTESLGLPLMVDDGDDPRGTAFTVSVDVRHGTTTGISSEDRAATARALADPATVPADLIRPGHVFPLRARPGGVLQRAGHTESAVDLCRLAGLQPAGVLAEITNDDGTMARMPDLERFASEHGLVLLSVADLVRYRRTCETLVQRQATSRVPTEFGEFQATSFRSAIDGREHLALVLGDVDQCQGGTLADVPVLVRVHSECLTGDVFGSRRCDCGEQLRAALANIAAVGRGALVYLRGHEGRGIGLGHKLRAYALQDTGLDTVDANLAQGLPIDSRDYGIGAQILGSLGISTVRLMSNNPAKYRGLSGHGVFIVERVPLLVTPNCDNVQYLKTKRDRMAHLIAEIDVS